MDITAYKDTGADLNQTARKVSRRPGNHKGCQKPSLMRSSDRWPRLRQLTRDDRQLHWQGSAGAALRYGCDEHCFWQP